MKDQVLTRAYIVAGVLCLIGAGLFLRTFDIAVNEGERWRAARDSTRIRYMPADAPRGNILSADGQFLATSQQYHRVHWDTRASGLTDAVFEAGVDSLALLLHETLRPDRPVADIAAELRAAREARQRYYKIARRVDFPTYQAMRAWPLFRRGRNRGGFLSERSEVRRRPFGMMAQRTIGYDRDDSSVGLERRFSSELGGEDGLRPMMRLPGGAYLPVEDLADAQPEPGADVWTTIDINVQDVVHQELRSAVQQHRADYGVAVVLETETGAVRAMSSLTRSEGGGVLESYNHAIGTSVEPGSTFKLASMLALLDDGRARPQDSIEIFKGRYQWYDRWMRDASVHDLDIVTVQHAFEMSSNVGIARLVDIGYGNDARGRKAFVDKLRSFGLDRPTGISLDGEKAPFIKDPAVDSLQTWSGVTLPWMSMGYEVELTPLQLAGFYNAVANDGRYVRPMLVNSVQKDGEVLEAFAPTVVKERIASPKAIAGVQAMLAGVVENGTAKRHRSKLYGFAGKTGTVQYNYSLAARAKGLNGHQASFVGYFPADDPKYTMLVLISNPRAGKIYGSDVALPAWRKMADKIYAADVSMSAPLYAEEAPAWRTRTLPRRAIGDGGDIAAVFAAVRAPSLEGAAEGVVRMDNPGDSILIAPVALAAGKIPDVRGMGLRDAMYLLENLGCRVDVVGAGRVKRQSVRPETRARGQRVKLVLG